MCPLCHLCDLFLAGPWISKGSCLSAAAPPGHSERTRGTRRQADGFLWVLGFFPSKREHLCFSLIQAFPTLRVGPQRGREAPRTVLWFCYCTRFVGHSRPRQCPGCLGLRSRHGSGGEARMTACPVALPGEVAAHTAQRADPGLKGRAGGSRVHTTTACLPSGDRQVSETRSFGIRAYLDFQGLLLGESEWSCPARLPTGILAFPASSCPRAPAGLVRTCLGLLGAMR